MTDPEDLLDRIDDAEIIGTMADALGDFVKVGVLDHTVLLGVQDPPAILDTRERREEFGRLWAEACRRADGAPKAASDDA